jgi:hypothetical protein
LLEVLTLLHTARAPYAGWTPAISSNYLQVRLSGVWPANQMVQARVVSAGSSHLDAQPETFQVLAI